MEHTHNGRRDRVERSQRAPDLARAWPQAALGGEFQVEPRLAEKREDIVGLYLNPPEHALVLSLDEKSQIQALDRTQFGLPLKPGRGQTMTHDYKRHSTTTLFSALNIADGQVLGACMDNHRHQEWLKFLRLVHSTTPPGQQLHLIADNYATHKHPKVQRWLGRHKRFHMHFTPTSASWLNMIERFFQGSDLQPRAPWCLPQRAREQSERGLVGVACWAQSRRKFYQAGFSPMPLSFPSLGTGAR